MKKHFLTIAVISITAFLGLFAILTALKLAQLGARPIAPTVPESKPKATSGDRVCSLPFAVVTPPPGLRCNRIASVPPGTTITAPGETRALTAHAVGGSGAITFTWTLTSSMRAKGNLSSLSGETVTWTAPTNPSPNQTWTIVAMARDALGATDSSDCTITFTYNLSSTPSPTPTQILTPTPTNLTPTPTTTPGPTLTPTPIPSPTPTGAPTHKVCNSSGQCVVVAGAGNDLCTSDVSCQPTITPPTVPQAGFTTPTTSLFVGGSILLLFGLSLLVL